MKDDHTTAIVEGCLQALQGDGEPTPVVRALIEQALRRLETLCAGMLHRSYRRLTQPPLNLRTEELLSGVVERLLKALQKIKPRTVREFFALAGEHMRWELNDLARRFDKQPAAVAVQAELVPAPPSSDSSLSPDARRILEAIDQLPEAEREVFSLVHIQGLTQPEAAQVLEVAPKTVHRHLKKAVLLLADRLDDLRPKGEAGEGPGATGGPNDGR